MTTDVRIPEAALAAAVLALALAAPRALAQSAEAKTRFDALLADSWEQDKRENPLFATSTGDHRFNDRLPSVATADLERRAAAARGLLERLRAIDKKALAAQDQVSYAMLERDLSDDLARHQFRAYRIPITADSGFHTGLSRLPQDVPLATTQDYENYIARLRAIPAYFDQHVEHMREGLKTGFTCPRIALEGYDATMRPHAVSDAEKSVFWKPFVSFPAGVPASEHARLRAAGREAITAVGGAGLPAAARVLHAGISTRRADDARGLRAARRARPTTRGWSSTSRRSTPRPSRSTRSASPRSSGSAARWTASCSRSASRARSPSSSSSCARTRASTRRRRTSC